MAEFIAEYSPPIPSPMKKLATTKTGYEGAVAAPIVAGKRQHRSWIV